MRLSPVAIVALLGLLFMVAVGVRLHDSGPSSPYFKGASAMNHRHAVMAADGKPLAALDDKAAWPDGYTPDRYRAGGVERFAGLAHRVARYFSEVDARPFSSRLIVVMFSLCVFTMYALVRRLWDCQAAGLIAAGVVSVLAPLVDATDGGQFPHAPFAMVPLTLQLWFLLGARRDGSRWRGVAAAALSFVVVTWWEAGLYAVALGILAFASLPGGDPRARRTTIVAHAVVLVLASITDPWLRELRAFAAWPVLLVVAAAGAEFAGGRLDGGARRLGAIVAATLVLTAVLSPVRAGAGASLPALDYLWHRLRFMAGKPAAPGLLAPEIRAWWSVEHAPLGPHAILKVFLPLALFAAAAIAGARGHVRRHPVAFATTAAVAVVAALACMVDRSALVPAVLAMTPFLALSGRGLSTALATRAPLVALGAWAMVAEILFPLGALNPAYQIASGGGFAHRDPYRFLWVSSENTDRQLVGFIASRTRVRDPFLGNDNITALLLTFAGRTSVPLAGASGRGAAGRNAALAAMMYQDEASLYADCRELGVEYVLYSIDYLLDTTRYSPRYLAGMMAVPREAAVFQMHFAPETLRHFTLVYENEHYRLYRVSEEPGTLFITDHPPVYQLDAFERTGGNVDAFRQRILELLFAYRQGMRAQALGNTERALEHFNWCLAQAPGYTKARVAVGTTLIRAERFDDARDVLLSVIGYAPDNADALYHTAYVYAATGETDRALQILDVFFTAATDPDLIERARLLKTFVDQGIPVTPRSIPE